MRHPPLPEDLLAGESCWKGCYSFGGVATYKLPFVSVNNSDPHSGKKFSLDSHKEEMKTGGDLVGRASEGDRR